MHSAGDIIIICRETQTLKFAFQNVSRYPIWFFPSSSSSSSSSSSVSVGFSSVFQRFDQLFHILRFFDLVDWWTRMPQIWKPQTFPTCKLHCFCAGRRDHNNTPCPPCLCHARYAMPMRQATGVAFRATIGRDRNTETPKPNGGSGETSRHRDIDTGDFIVFRCGFIVWYSLYIFVLFCVWKWHVLIQVGHRFANSNDWNVNWSWPGLCKEPSPGLLQRQSQQIHEIHEIIKKVSKSHIHGQYQYQSIMRYHMVSWCIRP